MTIGQYSLYEWITYFYIYSFAGWIFESCYVSLRQRRWVNRGFLNGPFLPIYGGGAVMMLFVSYPFKENLLLTYFAGVVGATALEYVTGAAMEKLFKVKYWDYSNQRFHIKGYICLSSSVAWGFFTLGLDHILHPRVEELLAMLAMPVRHGVVAVVSVFLLYDVITSVREALDLRNMLEAMEKAQAEMQRLKKRADVLIACVDDSWKEFAENHPAFDKAEEIHREMELRYNKIRQNIREFELLSEGQKEELADLREKIRAAMEQAEKTREMHRQRHKNLKNRIVGNPTMSSTRYALSLEALRRRLAEDEEQKNRKR
ncbi:MAG: hypothetical protein Q4D60_07750 [Eubacteriales bacterium]|nr:hypothetical protein [Eubacteriales bacterium]